MRASLLGCVCLLSACAHGSAWTGTEDGAFPAAHALPDWAEPERAEEPMSVSGLGSSLGAADVRQVMDRRQSDLLACVATRNRRTPPLAGEVRFGFRVRADGRVREVRIERSTLGHRGVERCLSAVAMTTRFPPPQGGGETDLAWTMLVDDGARQPRVLDGARWRRVASRRGRLALRRCEVTRGESVQVTAHITPRGAVASVGGAATLGARYDLDCVLGQVARWRMPSPGTIAKVTFDLR
jgi:TonB family protein